MSSKFYLFRTICICLSIIFGSFLQAHAQKELSFQIGHEIPLGELKWVYNPAISHSLELAFLREVNNGNFSWGGGIKYFQFSPKKDVFYYLLNEDEYGTISYSNYKVLPIYVSIRRDITISKNIELFFGGNFGYYYVLYQYENQNPYISESGTVVEGKGALVPKAGLNIKISDKVGVSLQSRYNFYFSLGQNRYSTLASYNPNVGKSNYFLSNQLGIYCRF